MVRLEIQIEIMRAAGLTDDEILRLAWLKQQIGTGKCDDLTLEHKRLLFLKHLYQCRLVHE